MGSRFASRKLTLMTFGAVWLSLAAARIEARDDWFDLVIGGAWLLVGVAYLVLGARSDG